jgi:Ca-activated chloride channel family protein
VQFAEPDILWLLLLAPLVAASGWLTAVRRRRVLDRFAGGPAFATRFVGQVSRHRRAVKLLLLVVVVACAILALARPQWGARLEPIRRKGIDVVVVLDTSLSMATEDVAPSRLGQAKHEIETLIRQLAGNRVGLVTFAGEATLTCPLTPDHQALRLFLDTLDVEAVAVPGTSLGAALDMAARTFGETDADADARGRVIVLFSDGEDHAGKLEEVATQLERRGITLYAVGCGTPRGGPIPLRDRSGLLTGYKKDREDKIVTSRLIEDGLQQLALDSGGRYYRTTPTETEIEEIARALSGMQSGEFGGLLRPRFEERFQIPLALALLALLGETLLGDRRRVVEAGSGR